MEVGEGERALVRTILGTSVGRGVGPGVRLNVGTVGRLINICHTFAPIFVFLSPFIN